VLKGNDRKEGIRVRWHTPNRGVMILSLNEAVRLRHLIAECDGDEDLALCVHRHRRNSSPCAAVRNRNLEDKLIAKGWTCNRRINGHVTWRTPSLKAAVPSLKQAVQVDDLVRECGGDEKVALSRHKRLGLPRDPVKISFCLSQTSSKETNTVSDCNSCQKTNAKITAECKHTPVSASGEEIESICSEKEEKDKDKDGESIKSALLSLQHGLQVDSLADSTNEMCSCNSCACSFAEEGGQSVRHADGKHKTVQEGSKRSFNNSNPLTAERIHECDRFFSKPDIPNKTATTDGERIWIDFVFGHEKICN